MLIAELQSLASYSENVIKLLITNGCQTEAVAMRLRYAGKGRRIKHSKDKKASGQMHF